MPLHIIRQDITKMSCDAIVNPSNEDLCPGGGVDAAIHKAAGSKLQKACKKIGGCPIGSARITLSYKLPCKYIIHTAGPVWCGGGFGEKEKLESCYKECLKLAKANNCESVAFPLISSGIYGYPKERVLKIAINIISEFLFENEMTVYLVVFDKKAYQFSEKLFSDITSYIDDYYVEEYSDNEVLYDFLEAVDVSRTLSESQTLEETFSQRRAKKLCEKEPVYEQRSEPTCAQATIQDSMPAPSKSLDDWLSTLDESFAQALFRLIDEKGISDVECYKKANIDKRTFSKIKSNAEYKPSKVTVLSFAIALELTIEETQHLLRTVGLSLSRSNKFDIIIEYFITNKIYDIFAINEALFEFDQVCLGTTV